MKKRGFTLIELLVVIAIIALLLAILIPGLKLAKDVAKRTLCASRLRQVGVAMRSYSQSFEYLPDAYDRNDNPEGGHGYVVYRQDDPQWFRNGKPIPLRWAKLYEADFMDTPEIFYCPGNRMDLYKYESYTNPPPWGAMNQVFNEQTSNPWIRIGYTYYPIARNPVLVSIADGLYPAEDPKKFTDLHPLLPYASDILWTRNSLSHQRMQNDNPDYHESNNYSVNALYADAHVSNCKDKDIFMSPVWGRFSGGTKEQYFVAYYTIFKLIGSE